MPQFPPHSLCGWINNPHEVRRIVGTLTFPFFRAATTNLQGSGAGKTVLLYKAWQDVAGGYIDYPAQTIGDCVSQGHGHGIDLLQCVEIAVGEQKEEFKQTCTEAIYGMSREVGGMLQPPGQNGDGSVGAWAAKAISTQGTVSRDVTGPYDGKRSGEWGWRGVPADIKAKCTEHLVKTVSLVKSWEELEDALANGYPVSVCSNQGFAMERDRQGFCRPQGEWGHCMLWVGIRNDSRPGACCFQSWGSHVPSGPLDLDQPPNSFWVDRATVSRMLAVGDSWAMSAFDGYPSVVIPDSWTLKGWV